MTDSFVIQSWLHTGHGSDTDLKPFPDQMTDVLQHGNPNNRKNMKIYLYQASTRFIPRAVWWHMPKRLALLAKWPTNWINGRIFGNKPKISEQIWKIWKNMIWQLGGCVVPAWSRRGNYKLCRGNPKLCRGNPKLCRGPRNPQNPHNIIRNLIWLLKDGFFLML